MWLSSPLFFLFFFGDYPLSTFLTKQIDLCFCSLEPGVHNSLIVLYSIVIILGFIGNFAIVIAFLTNKVMLTTRNIFIANLAISDILLCTFTMPLTLVDLLTKVSKDAKNPDMSLRKLSVTHHYHSPEAKTVTTVFFYLKPWKRILRKSQFQKTFSKRLPLSLVLDAGTADGILV